MSKQTHGNPSKASHGFTLIELMVVVSIIGVLAAVAVPVFIKYLKQSKTSEAYTQLKVLADSAAQYYQVDHYDEEGLPYPERMFPTLDGEVGTNTEVLVPANVPDGNKVVTATQWQVTPWKDMKYKIAKPHYYQYRYKPDNTVNPTFTGKAVGDLDGDTQTSTWRIEGYGDKDSITLTPVIPDTVNPLE